MSLLGIMPLDRFMKPAGPFACMCGGICPFGGSPLPPGDELDHLLVSTIPWDGSKLVLFWNNKTFMFYEK
jgi:hypothetical protein